jgi:hypothetical protein
MHTNTSVDSRGSVPAITTVVVFLVAFALVAAALY